MQKPTNDIQLPGVPYVDHDLRQPIVLKLQLRPQPSSFLDDLAASKLLQFLTLILVSFVLGLIFALFPVIADRFFQLVALLAVAAAGMLPFLLLAAFWPRPRG